MPTTRSWLSRDAAGAPWNATMTSTPAEAGYNPGMDLPGVRNGVAMHPERLGGVNGGLSGRTIGGVTRGSLYGYKADPTSAMGTPFQQYLTGGNGNGPVDFSLAHAMLDWRNGGASGPGSHRVGMQMRRDAGPFMPRLANAQASDQAPTGVMPTNSTGAPMPAPSYGRGQPSPFQPGAPGNTGVVPSGWLPPARPPAGIEHTDGGVYSVDGGPASGGSTQQGGFLGADPTLLSRINNLGDVYSQNLERNMLPAIRSRSIMAGGYGGSKEGIAEGIATEGAAQGFSRDAMNLLGSDWTGGQNRGLQKYGMDQSFYLGNQGQMLGYASDQRSQDRADLTTGASLYGAGTNGMWDPIKNANGVYAGYTGYGTTTTPGAGGGWLGALAGAGAGYQIGRGLNWGG